MPETQTAAVNATARPESRASRALRDSFESGRPLTYIQTFEEQRVGRVLREVGRRLDSSDPVPVWTWTLTEGLRRDGEEPATGTKSPRGVLDFIMAHSQTASST